MSREGTGRVDDRLLEAINRFARDTPGLHVLVNGYASYGIAVFALLLLTGWWTARHSNDPARMATALCAGAAVLVAVALNQPIVHAVARPRPYTTHHDLLVLAHRSTDPSFPSDHAAMAGAAAVGLLLASWRLGTIAVAAAIAMAGARVYIGAHYPSDVAVGLALGGVVAVVFYALARAALTRLVVAAGRTRLRPLLAPSSPRR
ncbi:MAG: rane-associated phospholipid phosphatase [Dactylosporangium sp.]|jgi:membrane-associated phospholipid phosphatase|nr:rane-associated phospholipid phosphatase [Dactylosporangium sp.]